MEVIDPRALYGSNYDEPRNVTRRAFDRALRDMHVLRDEFAVAVLGSVFSDADVLVEFGKMPEPSSWVYAVADAMLKAKFDSMTWGQK